MLDQTTRLLEAKLGCHTFYVCASLSFILYILLSLDLSDIQAGRLPDA